MSEIDTSAEAIAALMNGVTPGPWRVTSGRYSLQIHSDRHWIANIKCESCPAHEDGNARFIAAARQLVPALAAERDALRAENERLRHVLNGVRGAIETGHNEPLQIWRDQIAIALQASAALKGATNG